MFRPHVAAPGASVLAALLAPVATLAQAQPVPEVVVTATRAPDGVERRLFGGSLTLITPDALRQGQANLISEALRDVPGVEVSRTGGVGGRTDVRLRGAEANHTLVLIDGIKVADPHQDSFDFAGLVADEGARIEVLRGEQSALYGSAAIGGVVNVVSASAAERPGASVRVEAGRYGSALAAGRIATVSGGLDLSATGQVLHTDGNVVAPEGRKAVGADMAGFSAKLAYALSPALTLEAVGRFADTRADTNDQDYGSTGFAIDSDTRYRNRAAYGLIALQQRSARWSNRFEVQAADTARDTFEGGSLRFGDLGRRLRGSYVTTIKVGAQRLTGALDLEREIFQTRDPSGFADTTRRRLDTLGLVVQYEASLGARGAVGAAWRHDRNSRFRDSDTVRLEASYRLGEGARLHAAAGSGVKAPGPFELFGYAPTSNFVGNPDLKPERSQSVEAGWEQTFADGRVRVDLTGFTARLTDEIATDYSRTPSTVINLKTRSRRRGVEATGEARLGGGVSGGFAYTLLDARQDGAQELRRARNIASGWVGWRRADDRAGVRLSLRYNGPQADQNFATFQTVTLRAFTLATLSGDVAIGGQVSLYARVENLLDQDYQEVFGFREPGRALYAGLRARW